MISGDKISRFVPKKIIFLKVVGVTRRRIILCRSSRTGVV